MKQILDLTPRFLNLRRGKNTRRQRLDPDPDPVPRPLSALEEIVVTARQRKEKAQQVPIPLTVLNGGTLAATSTVRIEEIQQRLPDMNVAYLNPRQNSIAVRGLGNNPATTGWRHRSACSWTASIWAAWAWRSSTSTTSTGWNIHKGCRVRCSARRPPAR